MGKGNVLKLDNAGNLAKAKKKVLRQLLQEKLNVLSEDWKLHAIVDALCEHNGVELPYLLHGKRVDKKADGSIWTYAKGGHVDRRTKEISKTFFQNELLLREFVNWVDGLVGKLSGAPAVLIVSDSVELVPADDGDLEVPTLKVAWTTDKGTDDFIGAGDDNYPVLSDLSASSRGVGQGLDAAYSGYDILATRLVCHVAGRYGYTVFCSEIGVMQGGDMGEYFAFGISLVKLKA